MLQLGPFAPRIRAPGSGELGLEQTPKLQMLEAAEAGDLAKVEALLEQDASLVNAAGEYRKTALHLAAEKNHDGVAARLLEAGADFNRATTWGATPLEWAGYLGSLQVAERLIAAGATGMNLVLAAGLGKLDLVREYCETHKSLEGLGIPRRAGDEKDAKGWPADAARMKGDVLGEAFQVACRNGHIATMEYLHARGADINAKGYFGGTGLHWAAINGHRDAVQWLLDHGADAEIEDHGFKSKPEGWAVEGGHDELAQMIKNFRGLGGLTIER